MKYGITKEKLYSLHEVEELLQVKQRALYNFVKEGRIQAFKVGKEWRISGEALISFLEANSNTETK